MTPERLIEEIDRRHEFITLEDGYVYYDPKPNVGCFTPRDLRTIADELDRRNAAWEKQIQDDMQTRIEQEEFEDWIMGSFET